MTRMAQGFGSSHLAHVPAFRTCKHTFGTHLTLNTRIDLLITTHEAT